MDKLVGPCHPRHAQAALGRGTQGNGGVSTRHPPRSGVATLKKMGFGKGDGNSRKCWNDRNLPANPSKGLSSFAYPPRSGFATRNNIRQTCRMTLRLPCVRGVGLSSTDLSNCSHAGITAL